MKDFTFLGVCYFEHISLRQAFFHRLQPIEYEIKNDLLHLHPMSLHLWQSGSGLKDQCGPAQGRIGLGEFFDFSKEPNHIKRLYWISRFVSSVRIPWMI